MITKITGETPFQVLTNNFSISPSQEGYTLQISADGVNFSNLFSVGANVTRLVTGVAANSWYRLLGNQSAVSVNWMKTCVTEGGSGGAGNELTPVTEFPLGAEAGTVVALASGDTYGIYQYDGTDWNPAGGEVDLSAYWTSAETQSAITAVEDHLFDFEEVTASALTELHDGLLEVSARTVDLSGYYTSGQTDAAISAATAGKADAANPGIYEARVFPKWNAQGIITGITGGTVESDNFSINGRDYPRFKESGDDSFPPIYAPTISGNPGEILVSTGSGAPVWSAVTITPADPTTLKSVEEFNSAATIGDIQGKITTSPGLPDGVTFVTGNTYGDNQDQFGGTLTIPEGFAAGTTDQNPIHLMDVIDNDGNVFRINVYENEWHTGGVMLDVFSVTDDGSVFSLSMYQGSEEYGAYGFGTYEKSNEVTLNYIEDEGGGSNMIVEFYAGYDYDEMQPYPDPTFELPEGEREYGLYVKTEDGWKDISTPEDVVTSSYISNIWKGTQAEYDAITTKDPTTFYIIVSNQ